MTGKHIAEVETINRQLPENDFEQLAIKTTHITALGKLPMHHQDPFDRMLIAQAISEPLHLITHDKHVARYSPGIIEV